MKRITGLAVLALLAIPAQAKTKQQIMLQVHAKRNQQGADMTQQHGAQDFLVQEWDGSLAMWVAVLTWDDHTITLSLNILNTAKEPKLFVPSEITVILPNGHSYRAYSRDDVLQAAQSTKKGAAAGAYSGYSPPPVTTYDTNCSINGNTLQCRTTPDTSAQAGYAIGFALGVAIKSALVTHTFDKYIKQIKDEYLVSQQVPPGGTILGYVDLYLEDIHDGPFIITVPTGDENQLTGGQVSTTQQLPVPYYQFDFGPELIAVDFPKEY